jgi:chaperonin cofactor prefoldin
MQYHRFLTGLFIIFCLVNFTNNVFAEALSTNQTNLNLVERIARIEEGLKSIVTEMKTRFDSVDKRFELIDKRFELIDKRFETMENNWNKRFESLTREMNHRFEAIDKRFEAIDKRFEAIDKRFEAIDKRFEAIDKRFDFLSNQISSKETLFLAMFSLIITSIIALIGYIMWDRKSVFDKVEQLIQLNLNKYLMPEQVVIKEEEHTNEVDDRRSKTIDQQISFEIPIIMQKKLRDVFNFINQNPQMRPILNTA